MLRTRCVLNSWYLYHIEAVLNVDLTVWKIPNGCLHYRDDDVIRMITCSLVLNNILSCQACDLWRVLDKDRLSDFRCIRKLPIFYWNSSKKSIVNNKTVKIHNYADKSQYIWRNLLPKRQYSFSCIQVFK